MLRSALPHALAIALSLASLTSSARADAQEPSASAEPSPAERLFSEGRELLGRGEIRAACERFDASHTLMPSATGPLVNLAVCNEQLGRLATAARLYREVVERTRTTQPERADFAAQRLRDVEPRLSSVRIVVADQERRPGLNITLDGARVDEQTYDQEIPVDGGEHRIEATAPGAPPFRTSVSVERERGRATIPIVLSAPERRRTTAFVVGGLGAVAFAVGVGVGVSVAVECGGFFQRVCDGPNRKPTLADRERALDAEKTKAWIADVAAGVGLVGVAAGTYLLVTTPKAGAAALRVVPLARGGALGIDARF